VSFSGLKDLVSLVGGLVGGLYTLGYLVASGHARVLGLPVRSTEPVTLIGAAWEFLFRGTVIVVLRILESFTIWRAIVALVVGIVVSIAVSKLQGLRGSIRSVGFALHMPSTKTSYVAVIVISALLSALQLWQVSARVIPASAVTSLLFNQSPRSPFGGSTQGYFEPRWDALRKNVLGDGTHAFTRNLTRDYTIHVLAALAGGALAVVLWRAARRTKVALLKHVTTMPLVLGGLLAGFTPFYYGAFLKTYQYPLVTLVAADNVVPDVKTGRLSDLGAELKLALERPQFLLETSADQLYLFDGAEIHVLDRSKVGMIKFIGEDFVFRSGPG